MTEKSFVELLKMVAEGQELTKEELESVISKGVALEQVQKFVEVPDTQTTIVYGQEKAEIWNGRFYVEGTIPEHETRGVIHKNIPVALFHVEMTEEELKELLEPLGFTSEMENYSYVCSYAEETFSIEQAQELLLYLENEGVSARIRVATKPDKDIIGFGALPVGGETDFLLISETENYNLSFKVNAYIDFRQAELSVYSPEYIVQKIKSLTEKYSKEQFQELKELLKKYVENELENYSEVPF